MMKQMPYRVEERAIERAKYRAKMAIREIASATDNRVRRFVRLGWAVAGVAAIVAAGVVLTLSLNEESGSMDKVLAAMQKVPNDVLYEQNGDMIYYGEEYSHL